MAKSKRSEGELVLDDAGKQKLAEQIANLSDEEREHFLFQLETVMRKRRMQLLGYLVAMLVWALGMLFALVWYGTHDGFAGWAFLVPFAAVGVVLWVFGAWTDKLGKQARAVRIRTAAAPTSDPKN